MSRKMTKEQFLAYVEKKLKRKLKLVWVPAIQGWRVYPVEFDTSSNHNPWDHTGTVGAYYKMDVGIKNRGIMYSTSPTEYLDREHITQSTVKQICGEGRRKSYKQMRKEKEESLASVDHRFVNYAKFMSEDQHSSMGYIPKRLRLPDFAELLERARSVLNRRPDWMNISKDTLTLKYLQGENEDEMTFGAIGEVVGERFGLIRVEKQVKAYKARHSLPYAEISQMTDEELDALPPVVRTYWKIVVPA